MSEGREQICEMCLRIRTHFSASLSLTWHQMVSDKLVFREQRQKTLFISRSQICFAFGVSGNKESRYSQRLYVAAALR